MPDSARARFEWVDVRDVSIVELSAHYSSRDSFCASNGGVAMRCLILGGDGMLGHQLLSSWQSKYDVRVTLRRPLGQYGEAGLFHGENSYDEVDIRDSTRVQEVLEEFRPKAVVNAVGVIKQRTASKESLPSLEINSVFPHRLREWCQSIGARMVHLSTDCVFSGLRGNYTEQDPTDVSDIYGLSKYLGEVSETPCITLRSSIIGLELAHKKSLIEWFLSQTGTIKGFTNAIYTGLTTIEMARVIELVITERADLCGVWQVTSEPISKFELLSKLTTFLDRTDLVIDSDESFRCDRSLNGNAFALATGYKTPAWDEMLWELAERIKTKRMMQHAA